MCLFWRKPTKAFDVTLHLSGRHPYLHGHELDYPSRDVTLTVSATDWSDAAEQAMRLAHTCGKAWSWWVTSISSRRGG